MADQPDPTVNERFDRYVESFRRGEADPDPVMAGLGVEARRQLGRKIDEFLETGPVPDPGMSSPASPEIAGLAARIVPQLDGRSGGLSRMLTGRRQELGLSFETVVEDLAKELDATDEETEKIDAYYHDLEWGSLPAAGLADRLLDLLAKKLETTRAALREAGRALGPGRAASTGPVFARKVDDLAQGIPGDEAVADYSLAPSDLAGMRSATPPDRIDRLFTDG